MIMRKRLRENWEQTKGGENAREPVLLGLLVEAQATVC
jgi:hypothetical protein